MTSIGFAWRSLTRERARGWLGIAGVAIVGALLFDMLLLSRGLVLSFREVLLSTGFDLRVTATSALPGAGPPIEDATRAASDLARLPEVASAVPVRFGSASVRQGQRIVDVGIIATEAGETHEWRILRGEDLSRGSSDPPQLVVNEELSRAFDLSPGSSVSILAKSARASLAPPVAFRVVGVASFPFDVKGQAAAKMTLEAFRLADIGPDRDEADMLLVASRPPAGPEETVAAMRRARPDLDAFSVEGLLDRFRRTDFSYFRQISFALSAITAFFAALLVTTLLTVSVNQRLGEIAALRALGFSRGRMIRDLLAESFFFLGAGGALAVPLGAAVAFVLDSILRDFPGLPSRLHFFVADLRAFLLLAAILLVSAILAAAYPVSIAWRLPVADTLRREVVS